MRMWDTGSPAVGAWPPITTVTDSTSPMRRSGSSTRRSRDARASRPTRRAVAGCSSRRASRTASDYGCSTASNKKGRPAGRPFQIERLRLDLLDVRGLFPLGPLDHVEADLLPFLQGLEPRHVDRREMREQVLAAVVGRDEAIALRVVEPLHGACCHALSLIAVDLSYRASVVDAPCSRAMPGTPRPRRLLANRPPESKHSPPFTRRSHGRQEPCPLLLRARKAVKNHRNPPGRCWPSHCTAPLHSLR